MTDCCFVFRVLTVAPAIGLVALALSLVFCQPSFRLFFYDFVAAADLDLIMLK
ncbi:MAG: hypothetical protein CM15mP95_0840 [Alphaproteobacteria bacterium]|nr:MAG: hypothetical protein CM15mP95_0840 [Alphaproteobacteria bacterium]